MVSRKLVAAASTPLILAVLAEGESWGYAILRRIRVLSAGRLDWNEGMLYPVLHRLEREQQIEGFWTTSNENRRRRYYRLTPRGKAALAAEREQWLTVHSALAELWEGQHA